MHKLTSIFFALLMALSVPTLTIATSSEAGAWGHKSSHRYGHRSHSRRGETCWRTNRHTGARFRVC